jgi:hypothetical protein
MGQSRRLGRRPATSGTRSADILQVSRHFAFVPEPEVSPLARLDARRKMAIVRPIRIGSTAPYY